MRVTFWGARGSSPVVMDHARILQFIDGLIGKAKAKGLTTYEELSAGAHSGEFGEPLLFGGHTPCTEVTISKLRA